MTRPSGNRREAGQASVELLATVPGFLLMGLVCFQLLAVGYAAALADHAAEAGALAAANGRSAAVAARRALPGWSRGGLRARRVGDRVYVRLLPASPLRALAHRLTVTADAAVARPAGLRGLVP